MLKNNHKSRRVCLIAGKSKTYILGLRCKDGVVLISDRIVTRDTETMQENKLFKVGRGIIVGASGTTGFFDKFLLEFNTEMQKGLKSFQELLYIVDSCLFKLHRIYTATGGTDLEVLMGVQPTQSKALLYHAINAGYSEQVKSYISIGHGAPYGAFLVKNLYRKDMTIKEGAELGVLVIEYFNMFNLDNSVGGEPQVWVIPDVDEEGVKNKSVEEIKERELSASEISKIKEKNKEKLNYINELLEKLK